MSWEGLQAFNGALDGVRERIKIGAREGLWAALTNVLNVSNRQVPHEEGDLERDGEPSMEEGKLRGAVSYGRTAQTKDYAVVQHEDMTLNHDAGRNAKFLENAFNTTRDQSLEIVAAAVKRRMNE